MTRQIATVSPINQCLIRTATNKIDPYEREGADNFRVVPFYVYKVAILTNVYCVEMAKILYAVV